MNSNLVHDERMEYSGYNGSIEIDDEYLTITHSGLAAKGGGLATGQPRRIPIQAISGVGFKDATRLLNGWISIGLGGIAPPNLSAGTAPSNANTVMFRHKSKDEFCQLRDLLLSAVERNASQGIDPASVEFETGRAGRIDRLQAKSEQLAAKSDQIKEGRMAAMIGDDRPDIVNAAARMGWRLGGNRELKNLAGHLHDHETVRFIAQGTYESKQGILVLTDLRLLFLFHGMISQAKEDFPLRLISSVQTKSGLVTGELRVFVSGNSSSISGIVKSDLGPLADEIRQGMSAQDARLPPAQPTDAAPTSDPFEALQKLAALRDAGVLDEAEFAAKKQEILVRM